MNKRLCLWAIGVAAVLIAQSARANERVVPASPQVGNLDTPAATVTNWLSQTPMLTRITGVKVNPTADGVEVILQISAGTVPVAQIKTDGSTTTAEIPNAVLTDGKPFQSDKPIEGITSITIEQLPGNRVKVAIVGQTAAPTAKIVPDTDRLIFSVIPAQVTAADIEITVRGNRTNSYRVPTASVTRTNTPIIDTPGSVQVIPRQIFQSQKPAKFSDALRSVAGAATNSDSRSFFTNTLIRGFDTSSVYLKNGIPDTTNILQLPRDLSNVERLEILSGPASIVGGQISPGGIINVVTKQPLATPLSEVSASYGSFNTVDGAVDFSRPLNDSGTVGARLNAALNRSDTVFNVNGVDSQRYSVAPVVSWQVGADTKLTFEGLYLNTQYPQRASIPAVGLISNNPNGKIPRNQFLGEPSFDKNNNEFVQIGYDLEHRLNDNWKLRHTLAYYNLKSDQNEAFITGLQEDLRTLERSPQAFLTEINNYQSTVYVTGTFKTGNIAHEALVGIDYANERDYSSSSRRFESNGTLDLFNPVYTGVGALIPESQTRSASTRDGLGVYVQDQLKIFDDKLIVVLGGRFDFVGASSADLTNEPSIESQRNSAFSPRVGILYKVVNNVSLYGSYSQSFQQEIGRSQTNQTFDPSRGTQSELGVKADWLDNRLSTTLAVYDLTKSNVLTADPTDAALFYKKDDWNVALNVKNLFGAEYIEFSDDPLRVYPGDPRSISFSVGYKF